MIGIIAVSVGFDKTPLSIDMEIARFVNRRIERGVLNVFCYSDESLRHYLAEVIKVLYNANEKEDMCQVISTNNNSTIYSLKPIITNKTCLCEIDVNKNMLNEVRKTFEKIHEHLKIEKTNHSFYLKIKKGE
ncbi:MAG: hypothetical protein ACRCX8_20565 [Sarcina sp.]